MKSSVLKKADAVVLAAILLYTVLLLILPLALERTAFRWMFSEEGPFEQLSIYAWLFAALMVCIRMRPLTWQMRCLALAFMAFAAREADLHKAYTAGSILKSNYYRHALAPPAEKAVAFIVAMAFILLLVYVAFLILRALFRQGGLRKRSGIWLMAAATLMVAGKVVDRMPAVLAEDYGVMLSPVMQLYIQAFEEGYELLHPLLMAWAVWLSRTDGLFARPLAGTAVPVLAARH